MIDEGYVPPAVHVNTMAAVRRAVEASVTRSVGEVRVNPCRLRRP